MSTPMSLLLIGIGLIVVAGIIQQISKFSSFFKLWSRIKKAVGLHYPKQG